MKARRSDLMQQFRIRGKTYAAVIVLVFDFWLRFVYLYEGFHAYVCAGVREGAHEENNGRQSHRGAGKGLTGVYSNHGHCEGSKRAERMVGICSRVPLHAAEEQR